MVKTILVIGQLSPPHHGSNVMAEDMLNALRNEQYKTYL